MTNSIQNSKFYRYSFLSIFSIILLLSSVISAQNPKTVITDKELPLSPAKLLMTLKSGDMGMSFGLKEAEYAPVGPSTFKIFGNKLLLLDTVNNRLAWFDLKEGKWLRDTKLPEVTGDKPTAIASLGNNRIAVVYPETPAIYVVDPAGNVYKALDASPPSLPMFKVPNRVYGGLNGEIWVVDPALGLTIEISPSGDPVRVVRGEFSFVSGTPSLFRADTDHRNPNRCKLMAKSPGDPQEKLFHAVYRPAFIHKCEVFGRDGRGNVYALLIWGDMDITANAEVIRISPEGNSLGKATIPEWSGFDSLLHVTVTKSGTVIYMKLEGKELKFYQTALK